MYKQLDLAYWVDEDLGAAVARIPDDEDVSTLMVLPVPGALPTVEEALSVGMLEPIRREAATRLVDLQLPKLEMRYGLTLGAPRRELGMEAAFDPEQGAVLFLGRVMDPTR